MSVKDNKSIVWQDHLDKATNKKLLAGYNLVHIRKPERDVGWEVGLRLDEYFCGLSAECLILISV